jgi:hypothetical protein
VQTNASSTPHEFDHTSASLTNTRHLELLNDIRRTSVLHFTDLERFAFKQEASLLSPLLSQATRLSITLRLSIFSYAHSPSNEAVQAKAVSAIGRLLTQSPRLASLRIWLDDSGPQTWSCINERAVLAPILGFVSALQEVNVSITLPKLHPKCEDPERHFTTCPPGVHLHRALRQRWYGHADGEVEHSPDFPFLIDTKPYWGMPMGEVEETERAQRAQGVDVDGNVMAEMYRICQI